MCITDIIWFGLRDWKTTVFVFYRGPPSISFDLVDEDEVYLEQLVLDFCESEKRRIFQENLVSDSASV